MPLTSREALVDSADQAAVEITTELFRSAVAGVALWWFDNRDVPRDQVVGVIMNMLWLGLERVLQGEAWEAG